MQYVSLVRGMAVPASYGAEQLCVKDLLKQSPQKRRFEQMASVLTTLLYIVSSWTLRMASWTDTLGYAALQRSTISHIIGKVMGNGLPLLLFLIILS